ncbi:MAG: hypothetical protein WCK60_02815 [Candidatus Nomurabacteria bacterium]
MPTTNPNQYVLLDENIQTTIGQSNQPFGFTIGQETSLVDVSSFVLFLFLAASGVATIGRILYALGLKTANSDNESKITAANQIITSSLFALLMSFSLVLLFLAINPDIVTGNVDFSKVKVGSNTGVVTTTNPQTSTGAGSASENALRKTFNDAEITINKDPCATPTSLGCTNVSGMQTNIINAVLALKVKCNCSVQITGGTESGGHSGTSNHTTGNAVDILLTPQLVSFFNNSSSGLVKDVSDNTKGVCGIKFKFTDIIFWDEYPGCDGGLTTIRHYHASVTGR